MSTASNQCRSSTDSTCMSAYVLQSIPSGLGTTLGFLNCERACSGSVSDCGMSGFKCSKYAFDGDFGNVPVTIYTCAGYNMSAASIVGASTVVVTTCYTNSLSSPQPVLAESAYRSLALYGALLVLLLLVIGFYIGQAFRAKKFVRQADVRRAVETQLQHEQNEKKAKKTAEAYYSMFLRNVAASGRFASVSELAHEVCCTYNETYQFSAFVLFFLALSTVICIAVAIVQDPMVAPATALFVALVLAILVLLAGVLELCALFVFRGSYRITTVRLFGSFFAFCCGITSLVQLLQDVSAITNTSVSISYIMLLVWPTVIGKGRAFTFQWFRIQVAANGSTIVVVKRSASANTSGPVVTTTASSKQTTIPTARLVGAGGGFRWTHKAKPVKQRVDLASLSLAPTTSLLVAAANVLNHQSKKTNLVMAGLCAATLFVFFVASLVVGGAWRADVLYVCFSVAFALLGVVVLVTLVNTPIYLRTRWLFAASAVFACGVVMAYIDAAIADAAVFTAVSAVVLGICVIGWLLTSMQGQALVTVDANEVWEVGYHYTQRTTIFHFSAAPISQLNNNGAFASARVDNDSSGSGRNNFELMTPTHSSSTANLRYMQLPPEPQRQNALAVCASSSSLSSSAVLTSSMRQPQYQTSPSLPSIVAAMPSITNVSREVAEQMLSQQRAGTFLIRPSSKGSPNEMVAISAAQQSGQVSHSIVMRQPTGTWIIQSGTDEATWSAPFPSLTALLSNQGHLLFPFQQQ